MAQGACIVERGLDRRRYDEVTGPFRQRPGVAKYNIWGVREADGVRSRAGLGLGHGRNYGVRSGSGLRGSNHGRAC